MNKSWLVLGSLISVSANAQSGADALLNSLGTNAVQNSAPSAAIQVGIQNAIKLENAIARQLFTDWSSQQGLSYEANQWVQKFFAGDYENFAHLKSAMLSAVESPRTANFRNSIEAAYLYSIYRLNLSQTFFDGWMAAMSNQAFATSQAAYALDESVTNMEDWLTNRKIQVSPVQQALIRSVGFARHPNWLIINAFVVQRKGLAAEEILSRLPVNSSFRPKLSMTVALAYARKGDLANAAKILKVFYEPWMSQSKDPTAGSRYSLEIARMLYQAGSIDGAIQFYQKIPKGSDDYITAREELSWCWLRVGDLAQLRGNLETLNSNLLSDQFRPESLLVKSISDLKMCNYQNVEKSFNLFVKQNQEWAKKIEAAIQSIDSAPPRHIDEYSEFAVDSLKNQNQELASLENFANRSTGVALPAVGKQQHWVNAIQNMKLAMEATKKRQAEEFRRQWKSDRATIQEAIRKMQFVKIELLSQVSQIEGLTKKDEKNSDVANAAKADPTNQGDLSFPYDGVVWPDEVFKLRAVTNGQCAEKW